MKTACIAFAAALALATTVPAEAGGRGGASGGHGGHGSNHGQQGSANSVSPIAGAKAGAQVAAKLNVLNIVKVKAGVGLGLGLGGR